MSILLRLLFIAAWLAGAAVAAAAPRAEGLPVYPEDARNGPVFPFIGADGLGLPRLRRANVESLWGSPESVTTSSAARPGKRGALQLRYASLGLRFEVGPDEADDVDPRLGYVVVELPSRGRTPQGLYLGMPEQEALPIIEAVYRGRGRTPLVHGSSGRVSGLLVSVSNHGWRASQRANFTFRQGRLHQMSFQLAPRPLVSAQALRSLLNSILLVGVVGLLGSLTSAARERLGVWWERGRWLLAGGLAVAGVLGLGLGLSVVVGEGNGYVRLVGLVMLLGGFGLLVGGLLMLAGARRPTIAWPARALLGAAVLALLVAKLF
ncbi:MAG: hypothetical protein KF788_01805 [Piscinibacter sp.]|nr:hypothetical protein [Piscinibacter sp.]